MIILKSLPAILTVAAVDLIVPAAGTVVLAGARAGEDAIVRGEGWVAGKNVSRCGRIGRWWRWGEGVSRNIEVIAKHTKATASDHPVVQNTVRPLLLGGVGGATWRGCICGLLR